MPTLALAPYAERTAKAFEVLIVHHHAVPTFSRQRAAALSIDWVAGDATSLASNPPVECPSKWIALSSRAVAATISASRVARLRIEAVGRSSIT